MYDLSQFTLSQMISCGAFLRTISSGASSMEEAATRIVGHLYEGLRDTSSGSPACALVRLYKTHPYASLEPGQASFARSALGHAPQNPQMKCLTLMATAGDLPEWRSRQRSEGHQAIPLASEDSIARLPMIARLVRQLGLQSREIVQPDAGLLTDPGQRSFNVFHVERAAGSPYIPAQESFVAPHGIASVIGFGGLLPRGDLYAVILFSKVAISRDTADLFRTLSLSVKVALMPFAAGPVFAAGSAETARHG